MKSFDLDIVIDGDKASILLYADDSVFLTNTESKLQKLLDGLYTWYNKNTRNMTISGCKSNVVHFRPSSKYIFKYDDLIIELKNYYIYLGIILNEFLDLNLTDKIVTLGLVMVKCKAISVFYMMCLRICLVQM